MQLNDSTLFHQQAFINGEWLDADSVQTTNVTNPATGEIIGTVPKKSAAEARRTIEAVYKALPAWRALTAKERSTKLRWLELMIARPPILPGWLLAGGVRKPVQELYPSWASGRS